MENITSPPISDALLQGEELPITQAKTHRLMTEDRLRLAYQQTTITAAAALLVLLGFGILFRTFIDAWLIAGALTISAIYLFRMWLANQFNKQFAAPNNLQPWYQAYIYSAAICGIAWGLSLAMLVTRTNGSNDLFLALLFGGLIAAAIPSLATIKAAYTGYLLGIMIPVAAALMFRGSTTDPSVGILIAIYAVFMLTIAGNFRNRLDNSFRMAEENAQLVKRLGRERELSDRAWRRLTREISERQQLEVTSKKRRVMLENLLSNLPGMAFRALNDGEWSIEYVSDGCQDLLGMTSAELIAAKRTSLADILISNDVGFMNNISRSTGTGDSYELEYNLLTPNGNIRNVIERGTRVFDQNGELEAIDGFVIDVTEHLRLSAEVEHLNNHDRLTGLPNRSLFEASVQDILLAADRSNVVHSLLFLNLDQFKLINDSSGHAAGDQMLRLISARLQSRLRRKDILARWSGDEFVVFLKNCTIDEASQIATELCSAIEADPFHFEERNFWITASIGLSSTGDSPSSLEELLDAAEQATYAAKASGKNRVRLFDRQDDLLLKRSQEIQYSIEIPDAISEGRLFLERQLIVPADNAQGTQLWYEVLLRLRDRNNDVVYPGEFLPAVERYNLAAVVDTWVVEHMLSHLSNNKEALQELGLCFINLSGQSIGQPEFLKSICSILEQSDVPADKLCFEITETAAVGNMQQALKFMSRLKEMGCRFALDDFGTGLSSFAYLRKFPVDFLKIDGSFVLDIVNDCISRSIVASIKDVGHATGKKLIAEFVENDETLAMLNDIGIDYAQGFGISKPAPFAILPVS